MKTTILTALAAAALLSGCVTIQTAAPAGADTYRAGEARQEMSVRRGTITQVRMVVLQEEASGVGAVAGAALGGLAANNIGKGRGRAAATVAGAVAGGLVGNAVESGSRQTQGVEYTVRLDSGREVVIVQPATQVLENGMRVRIVGSGSNSRVAL